MGAFSVGENELISCTSTNEVDQPGQAAQHRDHQGFDQNLDEDVGRGGADGFADADFAHALGDARQHDVHDADAAHQQADAGDESAAHPRIMNEVVDLLRPILLGAKREILDALMRAHEHIADLLERFRQEVNVGDLQFQAGQARIAGGAGGTARWPPARAEPASR